MKTAIFTIALLAASSVSAWQPYKPGMSLAPRTQTITATPTFGGGYNYRDQNYNNIGSSTSTFGGGRTYRDSNYNIIGNSKPTFGGGSTFTYGR